MRVVAGYKVVVVGSRANDPRSLVKTMLQCFARCDGGIFRIGRRRSLGLCTKAREYSKAAVTILNMHLPATTTHGCRANGRELSIMSFVTCQKAFGCSESSNSQNFAQSAFNAGTSNTPHTKANRSTEHTGIPDDIIASTCIVVSVR